MHIPDLLTYSDNCRELLQATLLQRPEAFTGPIDPPLIRFKTVREIIAHMIGAEERWIRMRILGEEITPYERRASDTIEALFGDWERIRTQTRRFVESLTPEDWNRVHTVSVADVWTGDLTVEQILFHILNHEAHHRGQVSMALQQMGVEPPDFDYVLRK